MHENLFSKDKVHVEIVIQHNIVRTDRVITSSFTIQDFAKVKDCDKIKAKIATMLYNQEKLQILTLALIYEFVGGAGAGKSFL